MLTRTLQTINIDKVGWELTNFYVGCITLYGLSVCRRNPRYK